MVVNLIPAGLLIDNVQLPVTVGVGAEAYPVNPLSRIVPLFAIGAAIIAGTIMLWRKRVKIDC